MPSAPEIKFLQTVYYVDPDQTPHSVASDQGLSLFTLNAMISIEDGYMKTNKTPPSTGNGAAQKVEVEESTWPKWVNIWHS